MLLRRIAGTLVALSFAVVSSAQTPPSKPKITSKKNPVASKPAPKKTTTAPEPPPSPAAATDVQLRTKYITGAQVSENRTYIKGARQRFEFPGITMITQCDLKRSLQLHDATKRYMAVSTEPVVPPAPAPAEPTAESEMAAQMAAMSKPSRGGTPKPKGGVITETVTLTDTGERKQMFGLEARHIKTVVVRQPGENACETKATTIETDGWYADLPEHGSCPSIPVQATPPESAGQQTCIDRLETQNIGNADLGFALSTVMTTSIADAKEKGGDKDPDVTTMSMEVTELKITALDKVLFEVPAGYTEVNDYKALLPSLATGGTLGDAVFGLIGDGTSTVAPKKGGVIRVGVVTPANKSGREVPDVRLVGSLLSGFTSAPFESLPISGATAADLGRDAAEKACDYILVSDIAEIKTSKPNRVGGLLKKVSGDGNAQAEIHEVRVDYRLYAAGDQAKPRMTASVKASSGGGFGVGSALRFAAFAGQMYLTMGMGSGMMGMMGQGSPFGGLGGGMGTARMNPGMSAAMSIMSAGGGMGMDGGLPGAADAAGEKLTQTLQEGLSKAARQVADELKKGK
jgi:hypothetical protein